MNYTLAYVMASIGTVMVLFWVILYLKYKKQFTDMVNAIDTTKFIMGDTFFIGFGIISLLKLNLKTVNGRKKEKKIAEIYGEKHAEFYHHVIVGGQITYALTFAPMGFFLGAIANDIYFAILMLVAVAVLVFYLDVQVNNAVEKKRDEILSDYPEVLSKLTLLINAGLVLRDAWSKVAYGADGALYKEMQITSADMANGMSDTDAFYNLAQRCAVKEIRKFASVLTQNILKGGDELTLNLKYMTKESWEEKKHSAKRKGELASQKLLIPVMIMFVGILFMVIVPIFANMF